MFETMKIAKALLITSIFLFAGCGDDDDGGDVRGQPHDPIVGEAPGQFYTIKVDGRDCIAWRVGKPGGVGGGLSCDWSGR